MALILITKVISDKLQSYFGCDCCGRPPCAPLVPPLPSLVGYLVPPRRCLGNTIAGNNVAMGSWDVNFINLFTLTFQMLLE